MYFLSFGYLQLLTQIFDEGAYFECIFQLMIPFRRFPSQNSKYYRNSQKVNIADTYFRSFHQKYSFCGNWNANDNNKKRNGVLNKLKSRLSETTGIKVTEEEQRFLFKLGY